MKYEIMLHRQTNAEKKVFMRVKAETTSKDLITWSNKFQVLNKY